jgi:hypothetical protein
MKKLLLLATIASTLFLSGTFGHACVTSLIQYTVNCSGPGCNQSVNILVPNGSYGGGAFAVNGYVSCCGHNIGTVNSLQPGCVGTDYKVPAKHRDSRRYTPLADLLVPDCHGKFVFYKGSKGTLKLKLSRFKNG